MSDGSGTWEPSEEIDPLDLIKMTENGDVLLGSGMQQDDVIRLTESQGLEKDED